MVFCIRVVIGLVCIFFFSFSSAEIKELRIIHINDFHGFARPQKLVGFEDEVGGAAWIASLAEELRKEKPTLFLAAGDMIQGDKWANLFKGESVMRLLNAMGIDAMVLGNHEFDFGQEVLRERIKEASFPVLGANVIGLEGAVGHVIKELGGLRIAIVGLISQDTPFTTHPRNVHGLKFVEPQQALKRELEAISSNVDIVIVLSHCGYSKDREIASKVPGIQVIVGGHSHTRLEKPVQINGTVIVQAWEHGKSLGVLDLSTEEGRLVSCRGGLLDIFPSRWPPEPRVLGIVDEHSRKLSHLMGTIIGTTKVDLDGENVSIRETNFGNLVTDLIREVTGAQVALINGGSIRWSIPQGPITLDLMYGALPFDNYVVTLKMRGRKLWEALEHGVAGKGKGRFPQVSGIHITYCPQGEPGKKIREVKIGKEPMDLDASYWVATNDFIAAGGDGYSSFVGALEEGTAIKNMGGALLGGTIVFSDPGRWIRELVAQKIKERAIISPSLEGRIVEACP